MRYERQRTTRLKSTTLEANVSDSVIIFAKKPTWRNFFEKFFSAKQIGVLLGKTPSIQTYVRRNQDSHKSWRKKSHQVCKKEKKGNKAWN